jgi:DNA polymerase III delta subunit
VLKEILAAQTLPPALLIIGKDHTRKERCLEALLKKHSIEKSQIQRAQGEKFSLSALKDALLSPSLFASSTCIIIEGFQDLGGYTPAELKELVQLQFSMTPISSNLIFMESSLPSNHPMRALFNERQCLAEFLPLEGAELEQWITKDISRYNISPASPAIVNQLALMAEGDIDEAASLNQRLSLYIDEKAQVTEAHLTELFPEHVSAHEFTLIDLVFSGDKVKALFELAKLLRLNKNVFGILGLLNKNITTLLNLSSLINSGAPEGDLARVAKLPPWLLKKHLGAARKFGQQRLEEMLAHVGRAEILLKSKSLGENITMERLITALTR